METTCVPARDWDNVLVGVSDGEITLSIHSTNGSLHTKLEPHQIDRLIYVLKEAIREATA